ncbi:hypothetical protein [Mycolicibacterium llatzerense]|uniref:hypothetical protein n=1 Tax=Mycolicibacterium llatzerense TaxID=280871 RepID=UPI0021B4E606|nr:hypothetical protein [Mycolicibacterium llatzerense]
MYAKQVVVEYEDFRDQVNRHIGELDDANLGRLEDEFHALRRALDEVIDGLHSVF